jgi:hypothetical protein
MIEKVILGLYEILKVMKSSVDDVVVIDGHYITTLSFESKLSIAEIDDTGIHIVCKFYDIERFCNPKANCNEFRYNYDMPLYYRIIDMRDRFISLNQPICGIDDFREAYPDLISMRVSDPYRILNIGGVSVMMIPGIISLAKPDKASLDIYRGFHDTYILKFNIFKKKIKTNISIYLVQFNIF